MDRSPVEQSDGSFTVLRQGSYKNTTHTYGSSDVDIIAKLTSAWSRDLSELDDDEKELYHSHHGTPDYGYDGFAADVWQWLTKQFDTGYISWNGKAIEISDESNRLNVDVDLVPCIEHRYYTCYPGYKQGEYVSGMAFEPRFSNEIIINYPTEHYENGCDKHSNYKETVRIFKNARDYYNDHFDTLWTISAHSYGIECFIYNVPENILKRTSRSDRFEKSSHSSKTRTSPNLIRCRKWNRCSVTATPSGTPAKQTNLSLGFGRCGTTGTTRKRMHNFSTDQANRHRRYILIGILAVLIYFGAIELFDPVLGLSLGVVSSILYILFTRYLWKWEWLYNHGLVAVPDLNGTWEGHLYTSADEDCIPDDQIDTTGRQIEGLTKQDSSIEIEQTWDKILVTLDGPESPSYSRAATILVEEKAWPTLSYNYWNEGSQTNEVLDPHYGTAILEYDEEEDKLEGKYYNRPDQRGTHGILELYREN